MIYMCLDIKIECMRECMTMTVIKVETIIDIDLHVYEIIISLRDKKI